MAEDDIDEADPPEGVLRWLVACDESGIHGARSYGFGTLWLPWQRRGDFSALIARLRDEHGYLAEIKWTNVKANALGFYEDLIESFFHTRWLSFHCCIVEKTVVRKDLHQGDYDLARRKHFGMLLTNKIKTALRNHPERKQTFRVLVDPIHSRYAKADQEAEWVCNRALAKAVGEARPVDRVLFGHRLGPSPIHHREKVTALADELARRAASFNSPDGKSEG